MSQPTQPTQSSMSKFVLTIVVVVAVCGGIAALGLRDRREAEAAALDATTPPPPPSTATTPATGTEEEAPPTLLTDPKAEPTSTLRGKVIFDESKQMIVTDEESEQELTFTPEQLEQRVLRFHRDEEANAYWLDMNDGTRIELDQGAAKTLSETLPTRFTYGAARANDTPPEMLGSDSPNIVTPN